MSRYALRPIVAALIVVSFAHPVSAGDRLTVVPAERSGEIRRSLERLRRCFSILNLTPEQQAELRAILEEAIPGLKTDREAVKLARETLKGDLAQRADECLIGRDFLALRAAAEKLREDLQAVVDKVESKLSAERRAKLEGCLQAPREEASAAEGLE